MYGTYRLGPESRESTLGVKIFKGESTLGARGVTFRSQGRQLWESEESTLGVKGVGGYTSTIHPYAYRPDSPLTPSLAKVRIYTQMEIPN